MDAVGVTAEAEVEAPERRHRRRDRTEIAPIFEPESIAVIGASERPGSLGSVVFRNLLEAGFPGGLYPVNPKHRSIGEHRCWHRIGDIGAPVDLAVVVSPARTVPGVLEECGEAGVSAAVILSGGFREAGDEGRALEDQVVAVARRHAIRFVGPNCLGVLRPLSRLNASFSQAMPKPGRIALVSQSGAVCTALLDWAVARDIGFSNVVSTGIGADVDFGEILDYLLLDPATKAIMLYVEGVHDARRFLSALRAVSRAKPIVVMKVGRHALGERAAISHTGALVGADEVFDAALDRAGVVRVTEYPDFFAVAETLHFGVAGRGPRLAIVTNGGGPAVMAADALADKGLELAELGDASRRALADVLPAAASSANPVDVLGDADAERYTAALGVCLADPGVDAVLAILIPTALTKPLEVAAGVAEAARHADKPLLTCWMGDASMRGSWARFREHRVPSFRAPEDAVEAFAAVARYHRNRQLLLQAPDPLRRRAPPDTAAARRVVEAALADGRRVLDPLESQAVLAAFHIPVLGSVAATNADDAVAHARRIGHPVAMKLLSPDVTHKTDVGGVRLDVSGDDAVAATFREILDAARAARPDARIDGVLIEPMRRSPNARELMLGIVADSVFGPVLSVGLGGTMVEIVGDKAVELPPLNHYLAERMIDRTRAATYLKTFRGKPAADRGAVVDAVLRLSEIACELPWVEELDINPLVVDETGATAIDARVVLRPAPRSALPYSHMAIHPYPSELAWSHELPGGVTMRVRPIRPEDAQLEKRFVDQLSERSRYLRFMYTVRELSPEMLSRFTQIDYDREMALIAVVESEQGDEQVGVARYVANADRRSCEFAVVIADRWQGRGIATRLLRHLIDVATERRFERMDGIVLCENVNMLALARELGFRERRVEDDPKLVRIELTLAR